MNNIVELSINSRDGVFATTQNATAQRLICHREICAVHGENSDELIFNNKFNFYILWFCFKHAQSSIYISDLI